MIIRTTSYCTSTDRALQARCRQGPAAAKRQAAPHLHAALRDVRIGRMRLRHRVAPGKRHDQVAVGADSVARVAVKLQIVGIGPGPTGARHARLAVRRARDEQALRARGMRRPAQCARSPQTPRITTIEKKYTSLSLRVLFLSLRYHRKEA